MSPLDLGCVENVPGSGMKLYVRYTENECGSLFTLSLDRASYQ